MKFESIKPNKKETENAFFEKSKKNIPKVKQETKEVSQNNIKVKQQSNDFEKSTKVIKPRGAKNINRRMFLKQVSGFLGSLMMSRIIMPKSVEAGISVVEKTLETKKLFNEKIPLERQFKQGVQSDCQTVAALKQIALLAPEKLRNMIRKNRDGYKVFFPKIKKHHGGIWNFDNNLTVVDVNKGDIKYFRSWYGESGGLAQDVIYSALIKRMWDADKYPMDSRNPKKIPKIKQNFKSVKEYIYFLQGKKTMFLGENVNALMILTGESFRNSNIGLQAKRKLFFISENKITEREKQEKQKYIEQIRELFKAGRIWGASQSYGYVEKDVYKPYNDFDKKDMTNNKDTNKDGIIEGHAYAIKYNESDDTVTVYNPWNKYEPEDGTAFNNDGKFTLSLEEFLKKFSSFTIKE